MTWSGDRLLNVEGIGQRASSIRFDIVDKATLLPTGRTISPLGDSVPTVAMNSTSAVKRTLSEITLAPDDAADLDPFADRLRPVWVLENGDEYPLGVFVLAGMDRIRREYGMEASVSAIDQTIIVDQAINYTVALSPGASVYDAIVAQLDAAGIVASEVDGSIGTTISSPIAWPVGTSRLQIVNDLAAIGGAYSLYFDNGGVAVVRRVADLTEGAPALIYESGGRILSDSMMETDDLLETPNRYLVVDSSAADNPIFGSFDVPPQIDGEPVPFSAAYRGFVVTKVIDEQGLANSGEATSRAEAAYKNDSGGYQWVTFSSSPDPRHDTFDAVQYLGLTYREQEWSLPLAEGSEMTHKLRRVYA